MNTRENTLEQRRDLGEIGPISVQLFIDRMDSMIPFIIEKYYEKSSRDDITSRLSVIRRFSDCISKDVIQHNIFDRFTDQDLKEEIIGYNTNKPMTLFELSTYMMMNINMHGHHIVTLDELIKRMQKILDRDATFRLQIIIPPFLKMLSNSDIDTIPKFFTKILDRFKDKKPLADISEKEKYDILMFIYVSSSPVTPALHMDKFKKILDKLYDLGLDIDDKILNMGPKKYIEAYSKSIQYYNIDYIKELDKRGCIFIPDDDNIETNSLHNVLINISGYSHVQIQLRKQFSSEFEIIYRKHLITKEKNCLWYTTRLLWISKLKPVDTKKEFLCLLPKDVLKYLIDNFIYIDVLENTNRLIDNCHKAVEKEIEERKKFVFCGISRH